MSQLIQPGNLPALQFSSGPANLPAEVLASMAAMYDESFAGLGGVGFRRIRVGRDSFILQDGQNKEKIPFDQLFGVFVGSSPVNHAVWYAKDFVPGQEPEEPDLVWLMPTPDTFPDALPHQFRKKVNKNGREVWAFQILRRVAFVLMRNVGGQFLLDIDKPYIMDLSSMSLFGKGMPEQNMYKWSSLRDMCAQNSTAAMQIMPSMFVVKIVVDANAPSGVVMFMPMRNNSGHLQYLDGDLLMSVHDCAQRPATRDQLKIREKLGMAAAPAQPVQNAYQPPIQNTYQPPINQVVDPALVQAPTGTAYPQQVAPATIGTGQPNPPLGYAGTPAPGMQTQVYSQPQAPAPGDFGAPTALMQPVPQYPTTPVQAPVQVNAPAGADVGTLLQQAQQILNQGGPAQVNLPNHPAAGVPLNQTQAQAAMQQAIQQPLQQFGQQQAAPAQTAPVQTPTDPSVAANISNLMAQLGG